MLPCQGWEPHTSLSLHTTASAFKKKLINLAALGFSCGMQDLVSRPGIKPERPTLGVWRPSHWTAREVHPLLPLITSSPRSTPLPHTAVGFLGKEGPWIHKSNCKRQLYLKSDSNIVLKVCGVNIHFFFKYTFEKKKTHSNASEATMNKLLCHSDMVGQNRSHDTQVSEALKTILFVFN